MTNEREQSHTATLESDVRRDASCPNPKCTCADCACGVTCRCRVTWLGPLERRVMEILWSELDREFSAREVLERLPEYAYTTITTVLDRLVGKELLHRRTAGRALVFRTTDTRAVHTAMLMREVLMATRDPDSALASFVTELPSDLVQSLRDALDGS